MPRYYAFFLKHSLSALVIAVALLTVWWARAPILDFLVWISDRDGVSATIQSYGSWAPGVYIFLLVLQVIVALIPGQALVVAGAYVFGFVPAMLMTVPGVVLSSQLAFHLARWYGRPVAYRLASQKVIDRWDGISADKGIVFFTLSFLLPIFPADAMCYVAGLSTISTRRFLIANILGRSISTLVTVLVGAFGRQLPTSFVVVAIIAVIIFYAAWLAIFSSRSSGRRAGDLKSTESLRAGAPSDTPDAS
jgi:uncharacterized membrane protein YdjX (TVP38/TMEM64 family)